MTKAVNARNIITLIARSNLFLYSKIMVTPIFKEQSTVPPKLAFYCRNQKFGSILEGGNHSQHFLKPKSALSFVLLSAVLTLFFHFLQFSIRKKNVFFNYGQGGSGPNENSMKYWFCVWNWLIFTKSSLGPEPPWP